MKYYLAFDPGSNTGWAKFNADGIQIQWGVLRGHDVLFEFLKNLCENHGGEPEEIIYEDYRYNPEVKQGGKRPVAGIAIGYIEFYARSKNITIEKTNPKDLPIGLKWAGIRWDKTKNKHLPDDFSAIAHGTFSLQKRGLRKSALQILIEKEKRDKEKDGPPF